VLIVACASESCAASLMVLSPRSGVRWVGMSLWAAWNPAIFCLQEAIPAFGSMLLNNLNFDYY